MRILAAGIGVALLVAAFACWWFGAWPPVFSLGVGGILVLVGTLYERFRYKPLERGAPPGWQATDERFVDEASGRPVRVYIEPGTGERRYVNE